MFLTGTISASKFGWPLVFYVFGGLGLLWCILMVFFGYDSPGVHPTISAQEKKFIEGSLGKSEDNKHDKTPWKKILTSRHVWALLLAQTGNNYCFWTLVMQIPTYMNYVMHFNMKKNSLLSSLPYLALWVLSNVFGVISDAVVNRGIVKRGAARKLFTSIGLMIPAAALIYLGYTDSSQPLQAVVLLVVAVGFNAACFCGFTINHMDLSPNHAGSLMGLCNAFSQIAGAAAPLVVQLIVKNESDVFQWRNVFFLSAGINVFTSVVFIIFGSGSVQSWDKEEDNKDED
ncbi:putative inorganic phosphate cotransporter [Sitophilus oryzae]|uniref:Inorganic phosphate cotransporter n=1 Tax=Sitophilus oryzae TaxID=7048 RepID=A0A6J2YG73_SITOR|nr:putative inorganic phosphate cotransporter [Sitophilus oryzae]